MGQTERGSITPPHRSLSPGQQARDDTRVWGYHLEVAAEYAHRRGTSTMYEFLKFWSPEAPLVPQCISSSEVGSVRLYTLGPSPQVDNRKAVAEAVQTRLSLTRP